MESIGIDLLYEMDGTRSLHEMTISNISRFSIHHSAVNTSFLYRILHSATIVKEFKYTVGGRACHVDLDYGFYIFPLMKVLCKHKSMLEALDIDDGFACQRMIYTQFEDGVSDEGNHLIHAPGNGSQLHVHGTRSQDVNSVRDWLC